MQEPQRDVDTLLEQAAAQIRESSPEKQQVEEAAARVWSRLTSDGAQVAAVAAEVEEIRGCDDYQALIPAYLSGALPEARRMLLEDHSRECVPCRRALKEAREGKPVSTSTSRPRKGAKVVAFPYMKWALAAAAVLAGVLMAPVLLDMLGPSGPAATVATLDGPLFRVAESSHLPVVAGETIHEGEILRAGREGGSVIELRDGSLVELRARSEISIDEGRRGTTIELERGSVIVQAAEQRSRELYVATEECLVSVTGTIFSVNHGTKGSRVSVIEGEVRVDYSGDKAVLYPGEQLATNDYLSQVPFDAEIGWSRDLDQYLGLLAEYSQLRRDIRDVVPRPGLRYSSRLLDLMPENTVVYAALPNLGETITETRRVLQERLDESPVLAEWWREQGYEQFEPMADEIVARLGEFSDYLGEELAIGGALPPGGSEDDFAGPLALAEVIDGVGLRDFIEQQIADLAGQHGEEVDVVFLEDPFAPVVGAADEAIFLWIHSDLISASPFLEQIRQVARLVLEGESNPFTESAFYASILDLYAEGADILIAADLESIVTVATAEGEQSDAAAQEMAMFEKTGFSNAKHLVAEQKHFTGNTHHRVALTFTEARSGIASWLAAPAPMGSLDFISPDAKLMAAFVFKDPVALLDDLAAITGGFEGTEEALGLFEERHGLDLRDDFAATLGGEIAFAIDGPLLPMPSWKLVLEVYDPARFQWTVEQALADLNQKLALQGEDELDLGRDESGGRTFYRLPTQLGKIEAHYTFVEGYLVMAPSRVLLDQAIRFRNSGYSITDASRFSNLLPADSRNNFSALIYQDLAGVMQSMAERLGQGEVNPQQQQVLDELRAEAKPTLGYAYGETDRIILAASSHGDAFSGILLRLMGLENPLGFEQVWQETLQGLM